MAGPNELKQGQFVGTTDVYNLDSGAKNADDFNVRLRQNLNNIALSLNAKVAGYYSQEEYINGKLFYPDYSRVNSYTDAPPTFRQTYSKTIEIGPLPGAGPYPQTKQVLHEISGYPVAGPMTFIFVTISGCATDQANLKGIPLPFSSPTIADNIAIQVIGPNIEIIVGKDYSAFTEAYVLLEYIKF